MWAGEPTHSFRDGQVLKLAYSVSCCGEIFAVSPATLKIENMGCVLDLGNADLIDEDMP